MNRILSTSLSIASIITFGTGCLSSDSESSESVETQHEIIKENTEHHKTGSAKETNSHWGYTDEVAPKYWSGLNSDYAKCSNGKMQTPINIIATKDINLTPLDFNYSTNSSDVINNGHTVQVNINSGSSVKIDGLDFKLKQFHFHTPSENNINGTEYALEAHFVHATDDGQLAVVAVMFKKGDENPIISKIWNKFPLEENKKVAFSLSSDDIKSIMPPDKNYYKFLGSLTTPPCSENVKWNVFKTPVTISSEQVETFFKIFGHTNNRPIQETNDRLIQE